MISIAPQKSPISHQNVIHDKQFIVVGDVAKIISISNLEGFALLLYITTSITTDIVVL